MLTGSGPRFAKCCTLQRISPERGPISTKRWADFNISASCSPSGGARLCPENSSSRRHMLDGIWGSLLCGAGPQTPRCTSSGVSQRMVQMRPTSASRPVSAPNSLRLGVAGRGFGRRSAASALRAEAQLAMAFPGRHGPEKRKRSLETLRLRESRTCGNFGGVKSLALPAAHGTGASQMTGASHVRAASQRTPIIAARPREPPRAPLLLNSQTLDRASLSA